MASAAAPRAGRLAELAEKLTAARAELDRREDAYRALVNAAVPFGKQVASWRKLRGARRVVTSLEARINARLGALGNYCVGDATDAEENNR